MKLQPDKSDVQILTGHGPGWVAINGERVDASVLVGSGGERQPWACESFEELTATHFAAVADMRPEVVIFGSGSRIRFPRPAWIAPLVRQGVGVETMDTAAACRTYNILAGEGRHVVAALLIERAATEHTQTPARND